MNKCLVIAAIVIVAGTVYGFAPVEKPATRPAQGVKATAPSMTIRQPTAAQLQAASRLRDVTVQWDQKTGAPLSVRGQMLGARNLGGKGLTAASKGNYARDAIAILDSLTDVYAVKDAQKEFTVLRTDADNIGFHHARVRQMYRGLRVVGGEVIVHFNKDNQAYQVNGRYIPDITVGTTPTLTPDEAVARAQADLQTRLSRASQGGKPEGTLNGPPELVVFANNSDPKLAYELILTYSEPSISIPGRWIYTLDALSGQILNAYNDIPTADATITGNRLAGEGGASVSVTGTSASGAYYLKCTLWLVHNSDTTGSFTDSNKDAQRSSASWGTSDRIAMSCAYNYSSIQGYYSTVHNRNSYDNAGAKATANVHHAYGSEYNNAYWSPTYQQFFFYDGDGVDFNGLTVTDITAHEFTHAVTEHSANLTYQYESGALNESFSDVFGALVEFHYQSDGRSAYPDATTGCSDWLIAEDSTVSETAIRDMRNPNRYEQPSKYNGTYWYTGSADNGGVHYNNGVQNFFFYLLCEGGSGNNDGTSYTVTGIGISNAAQVAYRSLTVYCTASTDHSAARTAWISAATDLNSSWVSSVEAAWDGVGVTSGGQPTARYTPLMDDFDGDYYGDPTLYDATTGYWYIRLSRYGYGMASLYSGGSTAYHSLSGFWDNDWNADPTLYDTSSGYWYMALSTHSYDWYRLYWYASSCLPVCADFDGDAYPDPTLYSQSAGYWYILLSSYNWEYYYPLHYSASAGLLPFGGDFDGDWYADPTFYSPYTGNWYILLSSWNYADYYTLWFSASGCTAALGDFDGDYRADPIMRSAAGSWYVLLSSLGYADYCSFSW